MRLNRRLCAHAGQSPRRRSSARIPTRLSRLQQPVPRGPARLELPRMEFSVRTEADRINGRRTAHGRSDYAYLKRSVAQLIERYVRHLDQRADAGEISPKTAARYRTALRHLSDCAARFAGTARFDACGIDETFVLTLKAHLRTLQVRPNGHPNALPRPMTAAGSRFVLATARAAWQWGQGQDPPLRPEDAANPFRGHIAAPRPRDLIDRGSLDAAKICAIVGRCDAFQLITLAPLIFYGLRAAEPCCLFVEDWQRGEGLLRVACAPELDYLTRGRVNKFLPVPPVIRRIPRLWKPSYGPLNTVGRPPAHTEPGDPMRLDSAGSSRSRTAARTRDNRTSVSGVRRSTPAEM